MKAYISEFTLAMKVEQEKLISVLGDINSKKHIREDYKNDCREIERHIEGLNDELDGWIKKRSQFLPSKIIKLLQTFGAFGLYVIKKRYGDIKNIESILGQQGEALEAIHNNIEKSQQEIDTLSLEKNELEENIRRIEHEKVINLENIEHGRAFFNAFDSVVEILGKDIPTVCEKLEYKLYNAKALYTKRHRLFQLSLIINEAYILNHREAVKNNLNLMLDDNGKVLKSFFRDSFKYEEKSEKAIRQAWETFCMAYPVITTTLHSFSRENFHMLKMLFDYILVDEAGQILPYYLLAPLYRSRNAVIVGDEKQLEPIRDTTNKVFRKYSDILSENLNANETTAQGLANFATDFYEENRASGNVVYEGILLEEHRRCEKSIVQFSNKYVYDNRMIVPKEDTPKEFLQSNVCFIDIRGVKTGGNINQSEANAVGTLVKKLLEHYKAEDIAVIAPYRKQVDVIKETIGNSTVKVGTVHSFQGKDKEVVIMSMTIASETDRSALRFIGSKPNMLNVAFTRSKQQLFIVGNYSVLENCNRSNYLYKASEFVKAHGTLFSLYEPDSLDKLTDAQHDTFIDFMNQLSPRENMKFEKLFRPYLNTVNILEDKNHYPLLLSLFEKAESSVSVVCPWLNKAVIKDEFIENIKSFKQENKEYNIVFGYKKSKLTLNTNEEIETIIKRDNQYAQGDKFAPEMKQFMSLKEVMGESLKYRPPLHTKLLLVDKEYLLIGSHNWLSKQGQRKDAREEMTVIVQDEGMISYICEKYGIG